MLNFLQWLLSLFRPAPKPAPPQTPPPPEPAQPVRSRVLLIAYDPVVDPSSGVKLSRHLNWYDVTDLVAGFISDLAEVSGGMARYEIVQRVDVDEFPAKVDGFQYTPQMYLDVLRRAASPRFPQEVDYQAILAKYNILQRVAQNEIDEVWIFAFPHAGFYESIMAGPGAFWCNAPPLQNTPASGRRFVIMGFSYERQVGEMFESYGHRAESIMEKAFARSAGEANLWKRFTRYEKIAPGKAACGNIHFAPNSQADYDWGNPTPVRSECYDWLLNFPDFKGDVRMVDSSEWGGGEIRAHHKWWFDHFPRAAGSLNGVRNNWWHYVVSPQNVVV
jgi:hypothetical protein